MGYFTYIQMQLIKSNQYHYLIYIFVFPTIVIFTKDTDIKILLDIKLFVRYLSIF